MTQLNASKRLLDASPVEQTNSHPHEEVYKKIIKIGPALKNGNGFVAKSGKGMFWTNTSKLKFLDFENLQKAKIHIGTIAVEADQLVFDFVCK